MKFFYTNQYNSWKLWAGLLLLAILFLVVLRFTTQQGADTKEVLIEQYISALRTENPEQIRSLLPTNYMIAESELSKIIANSGGRNLSTVQTFTVPAESAQMEIIKLAGTYTKNEQTTPFTDTLYLQRSNNRWYLMLGRDPNGLPIDAPDTKID